MPQMARHARHNRSTVFMKHAISHSWSRLSVVGRNSCIIEANTAHAQSRVYRAAQRLVARVFWKVDSTDARVRARQRVHRLVPRAQRELVHAAIEPLQLRKAADGGPSRAGHKLQQLLTLRQRERTHSLPKPSKCSRRTAKAAGSQRIVLPISDVDVSFASEYARKVSGLDELRELAHNRPWHRRMQATEHRVDLPAHRTEQAPLAYCMYEIELVVLVHRNLVAAR
mmetsp:Transcript_19488/g.44795  ORF Transcript_19488/g.44795 Transcript_19488/m.44795 type:complete len:226 (+) Transcript_19488:254-931(+)